MSLRSFFSKITLRAYVVFTSISVFLAIVVYIVLRSSIDMRISGSLDVNQIFTAFITLISVILGWLFGRRQ